jgi:hypothetical protein
MSAPARQAAEPAALFATLAIYDGMLARCYTPTNKKFKNYGAQGVEVCARWRESFEVFVEDMGPRPSLAHSIDRKDPYGDYCPENTKWSTPAEQAANRREYVTGVWIGNEKRTAEEWMAIAGIEPGLVKSRQALGWPLSDAVSTPFGEARGMSPYAFEPVTKFCRRESANSPAA